MPTPILLVYTLAAAITPSDTVNIVSPIADYKGTPAIYVGGAGVVAVVLRNSAVVNFTCVAGQILPIEAKRVNATNTTATGLVALYPSK